MRAQRSTTWLLLLAIFLHAPISRSENIQPQQQEEESDRGKGAGAAQAAAMAGAGIAGLSCIMLMKQAQETEDPEMKSMLMMQAMQQCSQAAQSAQNAGQNKEAQKAVTAPELPKTPDFTPNKDLVAKDDSSSSFTMPTQTQETPASGNGYAAGDALDALLNGLNKKTTADAPPAETPGKQVDAGPKGNGFTTLNPIDPTKVDMDENAKALAGVTPADFSPTGRNLAGFNPVSGNGAPAKEEGKEASNAASAGRKDRDLPPLEAATDGVLFSTTSTKEENATPSSFDQMLTQLMGGGAAGEDPNSFLGGGLSSITSFKADPDTGKKPNIFEFASYQYRALTYEQGRIQCKAKTTQTNSTTSQLSPVAALSQP